MSGEQIPTPPERRELRETQPPQTKQRRVSVDRTTGSNRNRVANHDNGDIHRSSISLEATAYTAECKGCIGITKTGVDVRNTIYHEGKRIVAVDPSVVPLNSTVKITFKDGSTMTAIAADIGGAIKGKRIDILVGTYEQAIQFGRQDVKLTILN